LATSTVGAGASPDGPVDAADAIDYQAFVAASSDVNVVVSRDGVYRYVSPACERLFGWSPDDLEGRSQDDFVHPDDVLLVRGGRAEIGGRLAVTTTYRYRCHDGSYRWTEATSRRVESDGLVVVVSALRAIDDRHALTTAWEHQASTDPLTGLVNRNVLMDRLHQGLRRLDRDPGLMAVLYLDLDRFKVINDSLGHRMGDAVLLKMAERLVHYLRPADTLARLGGDEFVIVAEGLPDEHTAVELANRIVEAGRESFRVGEEDFVCTVSVGIASTSDSQRPAEELLREADLALYRAKDRGRDRVEVFDEELRTSAVGRLVTERMLRRALAEDRLVVEYQPIIDLRTGRATGAEALIRVNDPAAGLLQPGSFLEVAEETGLLIEMDEQVLTDAVRQVHDWHARLAGTGFTEVAINVTARHLANTKFLTAVIRELDNAGVAHRDLQIEVTERVLLEASNSAMAGVRALRDLGVQVGLDDFGTGYSSLAYLRQFPLDFVKIDRSFVAELDGEPGDRAIVSAIIGLCHALELNVVAEGVETEKQLAILEELGCDRAQGFLFAASAAPETLDAFVNAGARQTIVAPRTAATANGGRRIR
jgi:diguanylate cyclase (GGDEF)-like protein/PAS domain S-box-containing protein